MRTMILAAGLALTLAACSGAKDATKEAAAKIDGAATTVTETVTDAGNTVVETVTETANDGAFVAMCAKEGEDISTCRCVDGVFKAELDAELYNVMVASASGDEAAATAAVTAYMGDDFSKMETMATAMTAASEKATAQCGAGTQ